MRRIKTLNGLQVGYPCSRLSCYHNPRSRLKKRYRRFFSNSHNLTPNLQLCHKPLILCPLKSLWSSPSSYSISNLSTLPHSDTTAWTDGLVFASRWWEEQVFILNVLNVSLLLLSLSFSAGRWVTSYSAETYVIFHALKWCIFHFWSCNFKFVTLFSDSQSVLSTLSAPLPYLILKFLTDTQSVLNSLSESKVVQIQSIPGHSSLPSNDLVDTFAKVGASHDPSIIPLFLSLLFPLKVCIPLHQLDTRYPVWFLPAPNPCSIF